MWDGRITKPLQSHYASNFFQRFSLSWDEEEADYQTSIEALKHWTHRCQSSWPSRWHTRQLVTMTWWHDDPHTQNTARGSSHPLHRLPQYSDKFSRQINISDISELQDVRSKLIQVTMFGSGYWRGDETEKRAGGKDML